MKQLQIGSSNGNMSPIKVIFALCLIITGCKSHTHNVIGKWKVIEFSGGRLPTTYPEHEFMTFTSDSCITTIELEDTTAKEDVFKYEYFDTLLRATTVNKYDTFYNVWKITHNNDKMTMQCLDCAVDEIKYTLQKIK